MDQQQVRTWYVDSRHCEEKEDGNLQLNPGLPSEVGLLTNLVTLKLDHCGFSGTVPTQVGELHKLESLLLRGTTKGLEAVTNRFSGTIPTEIGRLASTMTVGLNDNRISGSIPPQIGGMGQLSRWEVQENSLSGTMPESVGNLTCLGTMYLYDTTKSGLGCQPSDSN